MNNRRTEYLFKFVLLLHFIVTLVGLNSEGSFMLLHSPAIVQRTILYAIDTHLVSLGNINTNLNTTHGVCILKYPTFVWYNHITLYPWGGTANKQLTLKFYNSLLQAIIAQYAENSDAWYNTLVAIYFGSCQLFMTGKL